MCFYCIVRWTELYHRDWLGFRTAIESIIRAVSQAYCNAPCLVAQCTLLPMLVCMFLYHSRGMLRLLIISLRREEEGFILDDLSILLEKTNSQEKQTTKGPE